MVLFVRLNDSQKDLLSDKLLDLANLSAGAMVIGQILSEKVNLSVLIMGSIFVVVIYTYSVYLRS